MPSSLSEELAKRISALPNGSRIGIDGVSASGKTTLANELSALAPGLVRVSLDDFLAPPPRLSYYPDAFDLQAFRAQVESFDDTVVADGLFLHHPALRDVWTLSIFLACDQHVAMERGIARDSSWMPNARERYESRYLPEEGRYLAEVDPASLATIVIDTTDLRAPRLLS
jgi:uridine kinase